MTCARLTEYLDGALAPDARQRFEAHLSSCAACTEAVTSWQAVGGQIKQWDDSRVPIPDPALAARIVAAARARRTGRPARTRVPLFLGLGGLGLTTASVLVALVLPRALESALPLRITEPGVARTIAAKDVPGTALKPSTASHLLAHLGPDTLGVAHGSTAEVVKAARRDTRVRLVRGAMAAAVEPRRGAGTFRVEIDSFVVTVVGTRFLVESPAHGFLDVAVTEGVVQVSTATGQTHRVAAGQELHVAPGTALRTGPVSADAGGRLQALLDEPHLEREAAPPQQESKQPTALAPAPARVRSERRDTVAPDYDTWRRWIVAGQHERAQAALSQYLRARPRDTVAWSLLADSLRKAGSSREAVGAYQQIIRISDAGEANRARYLAATVLQENLGDHRAAARLLRAYLATGEELQPLAAAAKLRLAHSLEQLGKRQEARGLLQRVLSEYPDSPAAREAQDLLQQGDR